MARPDFEGGWSRLGLWNLYGRLLNEGPWAALELKLDALQAAPGTSDVWASLHTKIEGGSVWGADGKNGALGEFGLTQLYVRAGNVLLDNVVWQVGTLHTYFGDLGLYDMRPTDLLFKTLGLSGRYVGRRVELLLAVGDSGYPMHHLEYNTVLTVASSVRARLGSHVEVGAGGELSCEPSVRGDRFAPHRTPLPEGLTYEDYYRRRVAQRFSELYPGQADQFPKPEPRAAMSYKLVGYLGFGKLGRLRWNNLFANFIRRHPDTFYTDSYQGMDLAVYVKDLTDQRYEVNVGDEMQVALWPRRLDLAWAALFGYRTDHDNRIASSEDNRWFASTVLRLQLYLTSTLHLLGETSLAREKSLQGNLWRTHFDSVFKSTRGVADSQGLEYGDSDTRDTWQLKGGIVINPGGMGIFTRPSLRVLYGVQRSTMHDAFGSSFVATLDQYDEFREVADRHWHHVVSLEAEAWF
jgi:hypothetical protein